MIEIFKSNLEQKMYWENKYSKERKEDLQSYDLYFTSISKVFCEMFSLEKLQGVKGELSTEKKLTVYN